MDLIFRIIQKEKLLLLLCGVLALLTVPLSLRAANIQLEKVARIQAPPEGKALINLHLDYPAWLRTAFFDDSGKLLVDLPRRSEFQLVCEPGARTIITQVQGGGGAVQVIVVDAAPNKIYDVVFFKPRAMGYASVSHLPDVAARLQKLEKREKNKDRLPVLKAEVIQKKLTEIEKRTGDRVYVVKRDEAVSAFEAGKAQQIAEIKQDFLGGKKSQRVVHIDKDDCR